METQKNAMHLLRTSEDLGDVRVRIRGIACPTKARLGIGEKLPLSD